jgi:hypothetical protein
VGIEPCTISEGLTPDEAQEYCGRELNPESSDLNDKPSDIDGTLEN